MKFKIFLLSIVSAVCVFLAVPNELFIYGNWIIGLFCLAPVFTGLILAPGKRLPALMGLTFGVLTTLMSYYWLAFFQEFSVWTITGTTLGYALYFLLFFPFLKRFTRISPAFRPFILAAAWTVFEFFKASGYLGFPWGLMAYPFARFLSFIQISDVTGVWGVSFAVVLINGIIAETLVHLLSKTPVHREKRMKQRYKRLFAPGNRTVTYQWLAAAGITAVMFLYGSVRMREPIPVKTHLNAVLVQQNIDSWLSGNEIDSLLIGQELTRKGLADSGEIPDIVVWSETSFRRPFTQYKSFYEKRPRQDPFLTFLKQTGTYLLVGSPRLSPDGDGYMNAVILLSPDGKVVQYYGKQHPVPFAEHVPFWENKALRKFFENVIGLYSAGWTLGKEYTIFTIPTKEGPDVSFGAPICFEDAFPYINRRFVLKGADLLLNLTNDSWSQRDSAETQHYLAAFFRAVELKRVLVRSTNAGVTAVIGPYGHTLYQLPLFKQAYLNCSIPVYTSETVTVYTLLGDWLPYSLIGLLLVLLIVLAVRERRIIP